jgi:hypothetical protein
MDSAQRPSARPQGAGELRSCASSPFPFVSGFEPPLSFGAACVIARLCQSRKSLRVKGDRVEVVGGPGVAIQRDTGGVGMKGGRGWKSREVVKDSIQSFQDVNGNVDRVGTRDSNDSFF